jgi:hypothetical protein
MVRSWIDKTVMNDRHGHCGVNELIDEITMMMEVSMPSLQTQKAALWRAAFDSRTVSSVKLVAGTGNHRELRCPI